MIDSMPFEIVDISNAYRGIAILVTCDYESASRPLPGTRVDAEEMETTFKDFHEMKGDMDGKPANRSATIVQL